MEVKINKCNILVEPWQFQCCGEPVHADFRSIQRSTIHDMYVDSDYEINTGELPEDFDEADLEEFVDNLNDWD